MMNFLKKDKKNSKKYMRECLDTQMSNNKILRENLVKEQQFSRNLEIENKVLKEELTRLKKNIGILSKDNQELAKMLNEVIIKYNIKLDTKEEIKPKKRGRKPKKEEGETNE